MGVNNRNLHTFNELFLNFSSQFQIVFMVQCQVSVERINKFMNADELDPDSVTHKDNFEDPIVVENADFTWTSNVSVFLGNTYDRRCQRLQK